MRFMQLSLSQYYNIWGIIAQEKATGTLETVQANKHDYGFIYTVLYLRIY